MKEEGGYVIVFIPAGMDRVVLRIATVDGKALGDAMELIELDSDCREPWYDRAPWDTAKP